MTWGIVHGYGALAKRAIVARAPVDGAWLCPAVSVSSGGVAGSRLSDVGVSCRISRRRRGWCDGALAGLQELPGPQYQRVRRQLHKVYWRKLLLGCLPGRSEGG